MATLYQRSGIWQIRFWFAGRQFKRSLDVDDERAAFGRLGEIEDTLRLLAIGRLTVPPDVEDVGTWIVSGGRSTAKPTLKETRSLKDAIKEYFDAIPAGAKSANSIATERTHLDHFIRILKPSTPIGSIGVGELQHYVTKCSKEKGIRGRKVQPETLRKELVTFGTMRRWAKAKGWCEGELDRKALKLPKGTEKAPFRTWAEIEAIVEKGGLTPEEERDLWDCLFLDEKEIADFLKYVAENGKVPWLHPAMAIAAYTGARRSEIMRSEIRDFDFGRDVVTLREKKRKHSKSLSYRTVDNVAVMAAIDPHDGRCTGSPGIDIPSIFRRFQHAQNKPDPIPSSPAGNLCNGRLCHEDSLLPRWQDLESGRIIPHPRRGVAMGGCGGQERGYGGAGCCG